MPRGDLEQLVRQGEGAIANDAQVVQRGAETRTYQFQVPESVRVNAAAIDAALAEIKICDPAIGSGAFPVGMMQEIVKVRGVLTTYLTLTPGPSPQGEGRTAYAFKRHAIQSSIYGVDIDPGAVDIAKLRLWLSLVVDEEDYTRIKPLPNLDYKIVCGNSLLGVDQRGEVKKYQGNVLNYQQLDQLDQLMLNFFNETNSARKTQFNREIKSLIQGLTGSADTFDFRIYFNEVFRKHHGFDVVIGNPPYVRQEQIKHLKDELKRQYDCFTGTADLYVFFYERGLRLLREQGVLTYISSNKYFRAGYGKKLREYLMKNTQIQQIIDFGDAPVFAAIAYPTIVITRKAKPKNQTFKVLNWEMGQSISQFETVVQSESFAMPQAALTAEGWQFVDETALSLLKKLREAGTPLGEYVNNRFYRGVVTGFNEAFVVDRATRDLLIAEHPSSAEVLKPFLRGRDVKRWQVDYQDLWLIFTRRGIEIKQYPAIYNYLRQFKDRLMPGIPGGRKPGSYEWYEIQDNIAYWQEFERSKVILCIFMNSATFAFDDSGFFTNNALHIIGGASRYVVAVLNSSTGWWFLRQICTDLQNGYLQAYKENLQQIPIPPASPTDKARIETLVQQCLTAQGQAVTAAEAEIDEIVARLYGLTEVELQIIRGQP